MAETNAAPLDVTPVQPHSPATRSLELAYALHVAIRMTTTADRATEALGALSAELVRELHGLDLRLSARKDAD